MRCSTLICERRHVGFQRGAIVVADALDLERVAQPAAQRLLPTGTALMHVRAASGLLSGWIDLDATVWRANDADKLSLAVHFTAAHAGALRNVLARHDAFMVCRCLWK